MSTQKQPGVLHQFGTYRRLHHDSTSRVRTSCGQIKRYVHFHHIQSRRGRSNKKRKMEPFRRPFSRDGFIFHIFFGLTFTLSPIRG